MTGESGDGSRGPGDPTGRTCVLADDMPLMRDIMRLRIEALGMRILGEADDGHTAVRLVREQAPDLLIVDLNMPGMDGIGVISRVVAAGSATRTLLYTADPRALVIRRAMQAGADGCLNKSAGHETLVQSVTTVLAGGTFVDPNDTIALPMPLRLEIAPVDLIKAAHLADRL